MVSILRRAGALAGVLALVATVQAAAQPQAIAKPNLETATGARAVAFEGDTFVNHGLVAVGRLPASTRDFEGESLGSFSGLALDAAAWRRRPDGSYVGKLFTLPDRGPNDVGPFKGTTGYRNRVHAHDIVLTPGAAAGGLDLKPTGGFLLTDTEGRNFTGKDAGAHVIVRAGVPVPSPAEGEGAGKVSLDSEAIARLRDGSFYVSDEYGPGIYYFDPQGRQKGAIPVPSALLPRTAGAVNMNGVKAPDTGRRNNQGLEALAVTPDGARLVAVLQSAAVQDSGSGGPGRAHTRILVYDISATRTPARPAEHYALALPLVSVPGAGGEATATAAQSEVAALNRHQFLLLARDGVGRGADPNEAGTPVYKSVLLVDTAGATNLAGTPAEIEPGGAIAPNGVLDPAIRPARWTDFVNLLNPAELARFGLNLKTRGGDVNSLSEKWESLGLAPALDPKAPKDFFLFVGNDNDFVTAKGRIVGQDFDAALKGDGGAGDNDNLILVYRLTLPTYDHH